MDQREKEDGIKVATFLRDLKRRKKNKTNGRASTTSASAAAFDAKKPRRGGSGGGGGEKKRARSGGGVYNGGGGSSSSSRSVAVSAEEEVNNLTKKKKKKSKNINDEEEEEEEEASGGVIGGCITPLPVAPPPRRPPPLPPLILSPAKKNNSRKKLQPPPPLTKTSGVGDTDGDGDDWRYVVAPMVGASDRPFRLLCRKYGAGVCYTPMMAAASLARDASYRALHHMHTSADTAIGETDTCDTDTAAAGAAIPTPRIAATTTTATTIATTAADRPLVAHVWANTPQQLADAAVWAAATAGHGGTGTGCDALDLNLGCPQRAAYLGRYGSYLLDDTVGVDDDDKNNNSNNSSNGQQLICDMVRAAVAACANRIPICVKIRLLSPRNAAATTKTARSGAPVDAAPTGGRVDDGRDPTLAFCHRLCEAGVAAIAIHGRQRAKWERAGPGARDGPADLHHVAAIRRALSVSHRHVKVLANGNTVTWQDVRANLSLTGAHGVMSAEGILDNPALFLPRHGSNRDALIPVWTLRKRSGRTAANAAALKKRTKVLQKLREIAALAEKQSTHREPLTADEAKLVASKDRRVRKLKALDDDSNDPMERVTVTLGSLMDVAADKLALAAEYLDLATAFPVPIRTVVFHVRRMCKDLLVRYQLLDECVGAASVADVRAVLVRVMDYRDHHPAAFVYDTARAQAEKEAAARRLVDEGRRQAYEARMMRKAKREGRSDVRYYLHTAAAQVPTLATITYCKSLASRAELMAYWKEHHGQHCLAYHCDEEKKCPRGRACAFLHVDAAETDAATNGNAFCETDERAG